MTKKYYYYVLQGVSTSIVVKNKDVARKHSLDVEINAVQWEILLIIYLNMIFFIRTTN